MRVSPPKDEAARLKALRSLDLLDTPPEQDFDDFTLLAAFICGVPISLVSLIDEDRQWFKSKTGLDMDETPRDDAFCAHAIQQEGLFVVPDAAQDPRFRDNPLVAGDMALRFYAGAPLVTPEGQVLGTLCVIDRRPRTLTADQEAALSALARQVMARIEPRRQLEERTRAERAQQASEARKAAILQSALDCIITIDDQGRVVEWNPASERTFGSFPEEAVGRVLAELIVPPTLRAAHRRGMAHYLTTGDGPVLGKRIEITGMRAGGEEFPVDLAITPIPLGTETLFTATVRDISERKAFEKALRDQEEQYRHVSENTMSGIYRTTPDGRILLANPAFLAMLGYDNLEQLAACNLKADGAQAGYERTDFKARLEAESELRDLESAWERRDGRKIVVCESAYLVRDAEGKPLHYEGLVEDITARKEVEEALRRVHDELEARVEERTAELNQALRRNEMLLECAGEGIFGLDLSGCTTFANPAAARMVGWSREELVGEPTHALMHRTRPDGMPHPLQKRLIGACLRDGTPHTVDGEAFRRKDGSTFPVEYISKPFWEDGRLTGAVVTFQDITDRKRAEEQVRASKDMLQLIMDNIPPLIFWKDTSSVYLGCNRNFAQAAELSGPQEVVGLTDYDLPWPAESSDGFRRDDRRIMDADTPDLHYIETQRLPDGSSSWVETNKIPLHDRMGHEGRPPLSSNDGDGGRPGDSPNTEPRRLNPLTLSRCTGYTGVQGRNAFPTPPQSIPSCQLPKRPPPTDPGLSAHPPCRSSPTTPTSAPGPSPTRSRKLKCGTGLGPTMACAVLSGLTVWRTA